MFLGFTFLSILSPTSLYVIKHGVEGQDSGPTTASTSGLEGSLKVSSESIELAGESLDSEPHGEVGWEERSLELVGISFKCSCTVVDSGTVTGSGTVADSGAAIGSCNASATCLDELSATPASDYFTYKAIVLLQDIHKIFSNISIMFLQSLHAHKCGSSC